MSQEFETAGAASLGGLLRATHHKIDRPGPCENCGTPAPGEYCPKCGQLQASFKRPLIRLIGSSLKDMFALDGRVARTLPMLFFRPGRLTRNYLDGKRMRYVPPFRLYLLSSLIFFFVFFTFSGLNLGLTFTEEQAGSSGVAAEFGAGLQDGFEEGRGEDEVDTGDWFLPDREFDDEQMRRDLTGGDDVAPEFIVWLMTKVGRAYENPELFANVLQTWAPRISFLQLPIFALILTLIYVWRRKFYIFDHVISSLHLQSFFYLLTTLVVLASPVTNNLSMLALLLLPPVFIYRHLRVAYFDGRIMAGLRTIVMIALATIVIIALVVALAFAGLTEL